MNGRRLTDDEAYNWLHENGIDVEHFDSFSDLEGYNLPTRATWKNYACKGRSAAGRKRMDRELGAAVAASFHAMNSKHRQVSELDET